MRVAVIGAGSWGTALALAAARAGNEVSLWSRDAEQARRMNEERRNPRHLTSFELPARITSTHELDRALEAAALVVFALPSRATRDAARSVAASLPGGAVVVSATKGIEAGSGKRMSEVVADELAASHVAGVVALSGPSFAEEVAGDQPTAIVAACRRAEAAGEVQQAFSAGNFRVYTNDDIVGAEIGGAAKNTLALAAGMCDGVGLGANSRAALITRGLAEITRLAVACGGRAETLRGLAGLGDLVLTCTGHLSRNRYVGEQLGRGRSLADVLAGMTETAEGVPTTGAVRELAAERGVEMPIAEEVHRVLYKAKPVREAVESLMNRPLKEE